MLSGFCGLRPQKQLSYSICIWLPESCIILYFNLVNEFSEVCAVSIELKSKGDRMTKCGLFIDR